jgi:YqjK-like protein
MSRRLHELRQKRAELLARISSQREQLADFGAYYHRPLVLADKSLSAIRFVYRRPLLMGVIAALLVARRRRAMGLARAGWKIWKDYGLLSGIARKLI